MITSRLELIDHSNLVNYFHMDIKSLTQCQCRTDSPQCCHLPPILSHRIIETAPIAAPRRSGTLGSQPSLIVRQDPGYIRTKQFAYSSKLMNSVVGAASQQKIQLSSADSAPHGPLCVQLTLGRYDAQLFGEPVQVIIEQVLTHSSEENGTPANISAERGNRYEPISSFQLNASLLP